MTPSSGESPQGLEAQLFSLAAGELAGNVSQEVRDEYLADTPESFFNFLQLCKCDRMYRSEVYDELYGLLVSGYPRILILLPRGAFKSTAIEASNTREAILNPDIRILYASETLEQAKAYLGWTKSQLQENEQLRNLFGDMVPKGRNRKWGNGEIWVSGRTDFAKKEGTLTAKGLEQVRAGFHYDRIIIDDPCSPENTHTRDSLSRTVEAFKHIFSIAEDVVDPKTGQIVETTQLIVSCTRYHDDDMLGYVKRMNIELFKQQAAGAKNIKPWRVIEVPAETKQGELPFKHLTREVLAQRLIEQGPRVYAAQMLLDPVPGDQARFQRKQFKVIPHRDIPKEEYLYAYMMSDTATTPEREDYTCLAVVGRDAVGFDYVLDMVMEQMGPSDVIDALFSLYAKWHCRALLMEKIAINDCYGAMIDERMRRDQTRIRVLPVYGRTRESKEMRVDALTIPLGAGRLLFSSNIKHDLIHVDVGSGLAYGEIPDQFLRFPKSKRNDAPDALSDLYKRDSRGAPLCPRPKPNLITAPKARILNGKIVGNPQAEVNRKKPTGNFWGNLRGQVGGGGNVFGAR